MTRFWKRNNGDSIERLLQAGRAEPRDEFAERVVSHVPVDSSPLQRRSAPRRLAVASVVTVLTIGVAGALGGVQAAFAGAGNLAHLAVQTVAPPKSQRDDPKKAASSENSRSGEADQHQYKETICHWADNKYVTITVSPEGAAEHKAHHPRDIVPAPPGGCPR
jgi:heme/copper-type cytochrome/quinol oxidase subunit 1